MRTQTDQTRINHQIRARQVRLIDSTGNNVGVMGTRQALELARDTSLDLVEVNSNVNPPICKLMDYGKFQYDKKKAEKARPRAISVKEVKLTPQMGESDLQVRLTRAIEFLTKGHIIRVTMEFKKGYQRRQDLGDEKLAMFVEELDGIGNWDGDAKPSKRGVTFTFTPCSK